MFHAGTGRAAQADRGARLLRPVTMNAPTAIAAPADAPLALARRAPQAAVLACSVITLGAVSLLAACSGPTSAGSGGPCTPTATVTLAPQRGTTLDCSAGGTTITLAANGATYLVVPEYAVDDVPYRFQTFSLGHDAPVTMTAVAAPPMPLGTTGQASAPVFGLQPALPANRLNRRQASFDLRMLAAARRTASGILRTGAPRAQAAGPVTVRDTINQLRTFHVLSDSDGSTFGTSVARLEFAGTNVYVYVDTAAPSNGFTPTQLANFGQYADNLLYNLDVNTFGAPTDIDHNGHVIMLLTQIVNGITPASECQTEGYVAGFFYSGDLAPGGRASNNGEIFYQVVPDPSGTFSCAHSVSSIVSGTPGTFLHELQHMINFGHHVIMHNSPPEEGWLDEGESIVATELAARHYEALFPPPTGRTTPSQIFPDSAEPFITEQIFDSYNYLLESDTISLTLHTDADCCLQWRGGDWLLLRYMGDQFDSTVYARLENGTVTGTANLATASGVVFPTIFANFGVALFADSLPGVPRGAIPPQYQFQSYNFRTVYHALFASADGEDNVTRPFPIETQALSAGSPPPRSMVPGTMTYYRLATPSGASTVTLHFAEPGGARLSPGLHPQVAVFRIQ